jgi:purine-nucleoside/S-methyl-5'-thioadenosine phosphorylase / adenosine deaminase
MGLFVPEWPVPSRVKSFSTTRQQGVSLPPFASLNLAAHVGDDPARVVTNRQWLVEQAVLPAEPQWLNQVHGKRVMNLDVAQRVFSTDAGQTVDQTIAQAVGQTEGSIISMAGLAEADASISAAAGTVCAVLTADCLPVLFCDRSGEQVAAAHAGWRGLANGVLEATVDAFNAPTEHIMAWLGPAIGPRAFEVGDEVRQVFCDANAVATEAFLRVAQPSAVQGEEQKWWADIYHLARQRLLACGVNAIYGGDRCSYHEPADFFSYRRDGATGRMASLIWLESPS